MQYVKLIAVFALLWFAQSVFAIKQRKDMAKSMANLKRKYDYGYLGIGIKRAKFNLGSGYITLVVIDEQGIIREFKVLRGWSVFAKFKDFSKYCGHSTSDIDFTSKEQKLKASFVSALERINTVRKEKELHMFQIEN